MPPERAGLIGHIKGVFERVPRNDRALSNVRGAVSPVGSFLEDTVPVLIAMNFKIQIDSKRLLTHDRSVYRHSIVVQVIDNVDLESVALIAKSKGLLLRTEGNVP